MMRGGPRLAAAVPAVLVRPGAAAAVPAGFCAPGAAGCGVCPALAASGWRNVAVTLAGIVAPAGPVTAVGSGPAA
jgi:hypothetical protein